MNRTTMIVLILLIPLSIWLNLYAYYKYGDDLRKRIKERKNSKAERRKR